MSKQVILVATCVALVAGSYAYINEQKRDQKVQQIQSKAIFTPSENSFVRFYPDHKSDKKIFMLGSKPEQDATYGMTLMRHMEGDKVIYAKLSANFTLPGKFDAPDLSIKAVYVDKNGNEVAQDIKTKVTDEYHERTDATVFAVTSDKISVQDFMALLNRPDLTFKVASSLPLTAHEITLSPDQKQEYLAFITQKMPDVPEDDVLNYDFISQF